MSGKGEVAKEIALDCVWGAWRRTDVLVFRLREICDCRWPWR
jgi:hypothetical protein